MKLLDLEKNIMIPIRGSLWTCKSPR
jgi:hypothetical protein